MTVWKDVEEARIKWPAPEPLPCYSTTILLEMIDDCHEVQSDTTKGYAYKSGYFYAAIQLLEAYLKREASA